MVTNGYHYRVLSWDSVLLASARHGQRKLQRVSPSPLIFLGSENTAAAATSVIDSEVLTWDVYSSMARSGLPNSGLGSDEVKAGTAADQRIQGMALPSNVTGVQVQGSLHGDLGLGELQETPGRKNTFTNWRTWAGEEVGSRERGSTGRHSGETLKTATNTLTEPRRSCHRRKNRTWSEEEMETRELLASAGLGQRKT